MDVGEHAPSMNNTHACLAMLYRLRRRHKRPHDTFMLDATRDLLVAVHNNNYARFVRTLRRLHDTTPLLLHTVVARHLAPMRRRLLRTVALAYAGGGKAAALPLTAFAQWMLMDSRTHLCACLAQFGIKVHDDQTTLLVIDLKNATTTASTNLSHLWSKCDNLLAVCTNSQ
jgi:hypothetical protein